MSDLWFIVPIFVLIFIAIALGTYGIVHDHLHARMEQRRTGEDQ
jgi:uncharacterized membrane protein YGL010W